MLSPVADFSFAKQSGIKLLCDHSICMPSRAAFRELRFYTRNNEHWSCSIGVKERVRGRTGRNRVHVDLVGLLRDRKKHAVPGRWCQRAYGEREEIGFLPEVHSEALMSGETRVEAVDGGEIRQRNIFDVCVEVEWLHNHCMDKHTAQKRQRQTDRKREREPANSE
jgi:hypothetical protein